MAVGVNELFSNGCGAFWVANAITSTILGGKNRDLQKQIADENEAFQMKMQRNQQLSQEEMERERIAFRRHLMDLTRQWQREERAQAALNMDIQAELPHFVAHWPLSLEPDTVLSLIKQKKQQPLNIILMHTPLLAGTKGQIVHREALVLKKEEKLYQNLEYVIKKDMNLIGDVCFLQDAHQKENNTQADIMNIHFLMGSIPTLILIPKYQDERISLSIAMWDEQASRPYIKPLFAMPHNPILAQENENYSKEVIEKLHYTVSVISGAIRDQYAMLAWGKGPTLNALLEAKGNERMKQFALQNIAISNFLQQECANTLQALETGNTQNLLKVYDQADITQMKKQVVEQQKMLNAK